tara:strand:- start:646 stop:1659 length:1014 start_codon:yes stop_codon:yes gene_type:complete
MLLMHLKQKWGVKMRIFLFLAIFFITTNTYAHQYSLKPAEEMSMEDFETLFADVNNWGRWGKDDQLGTLNNIDAAKMVLASKLVKEGISISMEFPITEKGDPFNPEPLQHEVMINDEISIDVQNINFHGFTLTHMDAVNHFSYKGKMYNGFPFKLNDLGKFEHLGPDVVAEKGIFTRGVLIDFASFFNVDYLEPGHAITINDFIEWEKEMGVTIQKGDAVLIRTGRWEKVSKDGNWNASELIAGLHATTVKFLKERDISIIGCDGVTDVVPSGLEQKPFPIHDLVIAGMGMPILDNLNLDEVAEQAVKLDRHTFLFVASPLKIPGGTGSPLNPLAIF